MIHNAIIPSKVTLQPQNSSIFMSSYLETQRFLGTVDHKTIYFPFSESLIPSNQRPCFRFSERDSIYQYFKDKTTPRTRVEHEGEHLTVNHLSVANIKFVGELMEQAFHAFEVGQADRP